VHDFPLEARKLAGAELSQLQDGKKPTDFRPMPDVGPGAAEIRIHRPHEHRIIYVAQFPEAIYVIHAFEKKSQKTPQRDLNTARANYAEIQNERRKQGF
jgi:phage-related protein